MGNPEAENKVGMKLEFLPEGTASEETYGFSRVVKVGELIHVAGTTSGSAGLEGPSAYEQASAVYSRLVALVEAAGGSKRSIYRVRAYAVRATDADEILRAQREALDGTRPATTLVEVSGLARSGALVEIELEAAVEG